MQIETINVNTPKFVYLMGYFAADGSFYEERKAKRCRFEFTDGYENKEGLEQSFQFLNDIKKLVEEILSKKIPSIRQRGNRYVLYFEDRKLEKIFKTYFKIQPGPKSNTINIPEFYKNTNIEKYFWLGLMDGDGIIAQKGRKIALEMCSKNLVEEFRSFLKENKIITELKEVSVNNRKKGYMSDKNSFLTIIRSPFYDIYANLIGFTHPRKKDWITKHLNKCAYFINRTNTKPFLINKKIIDYTKIFDNRVFVINGKKILKKYNIKFRKRGKNIRFTELYNDLKDKDISKLDFLKEISNYRLKMSKGSINSVKMPFIMNQKLEDISKFIRLRPGTIELCRWHAKSYNKDYIKIIKFLENIFDIETNYTAKMVPLFNSGVLRLFFSKITTKDLKKYSLPKWYSELKC